MPTNRAMICKLFLSCIFSTLITICFCQLPKIESKGDALKALKQSITDSNRQYIYNYLGALYLINSNNDMKMIDSSFYYLRNAVYSGDSINSGNKEITNESLCLLAQ